MTTREIKINTVNSPKIIDTFSKINLFVECYAKIINSPWVYNTYFDIMNDKGTINTTVILKRIDFTREFYHNKLNNAYENSPFNKDKTMYEIIQSYMEDYYPGYALINKFITKFLYGVPEILTVDDFVEINKMFKYIKTEDIKSMTERLEADK